MAIQPGRAPPSPAGDNRLQVVLEAERRAEDAVEEARAEAQGRIERARAEADRIAHRAEERIARARAVCASSTEQAIRDLVAAQSEEVDRLERLRGQPERLRAAVTRVAAWLLGAELFGSEPVGMDEEGWL